MNRYFVIITEDELLPRVAPTLIALRLVDKLGQDKSTSVEVFDSECEMWKFCAEHGSSAADGVGDLEEFDESEPLYEHHKFEQTSRVTGFLVATCAVAPPVSSMTEDWSVTKVSKLEELENRIEVLEEEMGSRHNPSKVMKCRIPKCRILYEDE